MAVAPEVNRKVLRGFTHLFVLLNGKKKGKFRPF